MTLNQRFSVVALLLLGCSAKAQTDAMLLEAIAQVESGCDRNAIGKAGEKGMYQLKKAAWDDANALLESEKHFHHQWSQWRNAVAQDMIAAAHLRMIRERFRRIGVYNPTPEHLALVWNVGWSGAVERRFAFNDYAVRVGNLFRSQKVSTR